MGVPSECDIATAAAQAGLAITGAFHPVAEDRAPPHVATLVLLGGRGASLWRAFATSPEYGDGAPDPLDRWSARVIGALAGALGAEAFFPFGGPPYQPFIRWAARGEPAFPSPVGMQVSRGRGLWGSHRGALGFRQRLSLRRRDGTSPCVGCPAPCLGACPVDAFASGRYDVPACVAHLESEAGAGCLSGCRVRAACPFGADAAPPEAQRRFHMRAFVESQRAIAGLD